jgi:hypothetical protein
MPGHDPNDRRYDREVERRVKRMDPEELDAMMRGEDLGEQRPLGLGDRQAWWKREGRDDLNALLRTEWNPIGTRVPENEYASYAGQIGRLLCERSSESKIAAYLQDARTGGMGLPTDAGSDCRVARRILAWYAETMA